MQIRVNGEARDVAATTLDALVAELEYGDVPVATALNQAFVRRPDRANTQLNVGDNVEIVAPRQGG